MPGPLRATFASFAAFLFVDLVSLLPFVVPGLSPDARLLAGSAGTAVAFFDVGAAKGTFLGRSAPRASQEALLTGGVAALLGQSEPDRL